MGDADGLELFLRDRHAVEANEAEKAGAHHVAAGPVVGVTSTTSGNTSPSGARLRSFGPGGAADRCLVNSTRLASHERTARPGQLKALSAEAFENPGRGIGANPAERD